MPDKMQILKSPHAIARAKERYNLDLTDEDIEYICKFCWAGNAGLPLLIKTIHGEYKHSSSQTRIFRMMYRGVLIEPVIYKVKGKNILKCVTINPPPENPEARFYVSNRRRKLEEPNN